MIVSTVFESEGKQGRSTVSNSNEQELSGWNFHALAQFPTDYRYFAALLVHSQEIDQSFKGWLSQMMFYRQQPIKSSEFTEMINAQIDLI